MALPAQQTTKSITIVRQGQNIHNSSAAPKRGPFSFLCAALYRSKARFLETNLVPLASFFYEVPLIQLFKTKLVDLPHAKATMHY